MQIYREFAKDKKNETHLRKKVKGGFNPPSFFSHFIFQRRNTHG
jgi:hypothetical protein